MKHCLAPTMFTTSNRNSKNYHQGINAIKRALCLNKKILANLVKISCKVKKTVWILYKLCNGVNSDDNENSLA